MDPGYRRTSQRAELLAAIKGLELLIANDSGHGHNSGERNHLTGHHLRGANEESAPEGVYIVVTDSEYVVQGITDWVPQWKANNWKNKQNARPANLDLFQRLDALVATPLANDFIVQFFHVPLELNALADRLAREGADKLHDSTQ
ncbi:ribonuclease H-like domain-containing protein [Mycena amicta]|nr:ribonuclease H-like domain-containing protein [Mycena amicta]